MKLLKLVITSLLVLPFLASCNKEVKNKTLPPEDFMVGTWNCRCGGLNKLVFDESGKVTIKVNAMGPNYKIGECDYNFELEGTYSFNPETREVTFEDKLYMTKGINSANSTCIVLNPPEYKPRMAGLLEIKNNMPVLTYQVDIETKAIRMNSFNGRESTEENPVIFKKE